MKKLCSREKKATNSQFILCVNYVFILQQQKYLGFSCDWNRLVDTNDKKKIQLKFGSIY